MALNPYYDAWRRMYGRLIPDIYQSYYQGAFPSGSAASPTAVPQSAQVGFSPLANQPSSFATQFNAPSGTQQAFSYGQNIGLQPAGTGQKGQGQKGSAGHPVYDPYWQYWNPKTKSYQQEKFTEVEEGQVGSGFPDYGPPEEGYYYGKYNYYNPNGKADGVFAPTGTTAETSTKPNVVAPNIPTAPTSSIYNTGSSGCSGGVCKSPAQIAWEQKTKQPATPTYTTTRTTGGSYVTEAQKQALQAKGLWRPNATYSASYLKSLGV